MTLTTVGIPALFSVATAAPQFSDYFSNQQTDYYGENAYNNGFGEDSMDPYQILMDSVGNNHNTCLQHELMSNYNFFSDMDINCNVCYLDCLDKTVDLSNYHKMGGVGFWIRHHEWTADMPAPDITSCSQVSSKCSEASGCLSFCDMIFKYFMKEDYQEGKVIPGKRTDSFQRCVSRADQMWAAALEGGENTN